MINAAVHTFVFCVCGLCVYKFTDHEHFGLCHCQGLTIIKPIVYGNVARYFGKKREEDGHTHQWTVYLKPYRNEVINNV